MSTAAPDQVVDPAALIRSRDYRRLLVVAAVIGILVSLVSWAFLELIHYLQEGVYKDLPDWLGFTSVPTWWPIPVMVAPGVLTALVLIPAAALLPSPSVAAP